MKPLLFVAIIVLPVWLLHAGVASDDCTAIYDYDSSVPPVVEQQTLLEDDTMVEYSLLLHSSNDELVPALLSVPKKNGGPFPVVILLHGYGGEKEDMIEAAEPLAQRGYAAVAIDAQYHGDRKQEGRNMYSADSDETIGAFVQTVVDVRRLIDHLETRDDLDGSRVGLVGGSMGALLGAIAAGVDGRIDVPVLVVGGGNMELMLGQSNLSRVKEIREELEETGRTIEEVAQELACIDPINFVELISPRPLLMLNGLEDDVVPVASNRALFARARQPKKIVWYDTGHDVPVEDAAVKAFFWFEKHLKHTFYLQTWFHATVILAIAIPLASYGCRRWASARAS
jgi:cephalosporin-C deacetylase-like acetyl esterase